MATPSNIKTTIAQYGPRHRELYERPDCNAIIKVNITDDAWLRALMADACGFASFTEAREAVREAIVRAVPKTWALMNHRGQPAPECAFSTESVTPGSKATYHEAARVIGFNLDTFTDWSLIVNHPIPAPTLDQMAEDACLFYYLIPTEHGGFFDAPLQTVIHELLHAEYQRHVIPYTPTPIREEIGRKTLPEGYRITRVNTTGCGFTERYVVGDENGNEVSSILPSKSEEELEEGIVDQLAHRMTPRLSSLVDEPLLSHRPAWPVEVFESCPGLWALAYSSGALVVERSEEELRSYLTPDCGLGDVIDPAFRRLSRPQQIAFWRWGNGQPASNEFGREIEGNGGDEEQKGFEVVARWLGYPGAQSKVVRRRRSCKAESHRLYEVLFG
jgi:hypothetical protein